MEIRLHPIINLALDGGSLVKFTSRLVYSRKRTPLPIGEKVHWVPRDGLDVSEDRLNRFTPTATQTRDRTDYGLVAIPTRDKTWLRAELLNQLEEKNMTF